MGFPSWRLMVQTPSQVLLDVGDVDWVEVATASLGPLRILRGHAPLVAETAAGLVRYGTASGEHRLGVEAGLVSITPGRVTVFTAGGQLMADVPRDDERVAFRV